MDIVLRRATDRGIACYHALLAVTEADNVAVAARGFDEKVDESVAAGVDNP